MIERSPDAMVFPARHPLLHAARWWSGLWLLVVLASAAAWAAEAAPTRDAVTLRATTPVLDPWPAVRRLSDAAHALSAEQALAALDRFEPAGPKVNLGRRTETLWLHLPLQLVDDSTGWWLALDYASLDEVELFVWREGRIVQRARMGDHLAVVDRPAATRRHAVELRLVPGLRHELLLRVRTTSSMVLPLQLLRSAELVAAEARSQTVQGAMFGLGLVVLGYSLVGLWVLRDPVFLWFGLATAATTLFFAAYLGWAPLLLWPDSLWLTRNAAPLMMVLLVSCGALFIDRSLDMPVHAPRASRAMRAVALLTLASALLFVAGVLSYRAVSAVATVTGLLPGLIALSVAFRLARAGERIAQLTFAGWVVYSVGVVTFALVQGGRVPYTGWTHHALQVCSILELLVWVIILTLRAERLRHQASLARRENERLRTIAQTDPLTGLLNRRGLEQSLQQLIPEVSGQSMAALYVIDLDGFKGVNDRHGHHVGDELLVQVAARLRRVLRTSDLVARTGGDEFVVVAAQLHSAREAEQIGHKLLACGDASFALTGASCSVGMTVGYALAPADGIDAAALIQRADAAMYAGKQAGKHRLARAEAGLAPG